MSPRRLRFAFVVPASFPFVIPRKRESMFSEPLFLRLAVPVDFREFVAILFRCWRFRVAMMGLIDLFLVLLDQMLVRRVELAIGRWHQSLALV